jgi:hypothetical protein
MVKRYFATVKEAWTELGEPEPLKGPVVFGPFVFPDERQRWLDQEGLSVGYDVSLWSTEITVEDPAPREG